MNSEKEFKNLIKKISVFNDKEIIRRLSKNRYLNHIKMELNKTNSAFRFDTLLKVTKNLSITGKTDLTKDILKRNKDSPTKIAYICLNMAQYFDGSFCDILGKALDSYEENPFVAASIINALIEIRCDKFIKKITKINDKYRTTEPLISRAAQTYLNEFKK